MTAPAPVEGKCARCKQPRPLFPYKPEHDCIEAAGLVRLNEAAEWIDQIRDSDDRWCESRLTFPGLRRNLCVPCHDREHADEAAYIKEHQL